jgi:hypothetical protein
VARPETINPFPSTVAAAELRLATPQSNRTTLFTVARSGE